MIDGRGYTHREISYSPEQLRNKKQNLYVITDVPEQVVPEFSSLTDGVLTSFDDFMNTDIINSAYYISMSRADLAIPYLQNIVLFGGVFAPPPDFSKKPYYLIADKVLETYAETTSILGAEPFMGLDVHAQICQAVALTKDVEGDFVEIGVFTGSSALTALIHMRNLGIKRRSFLLDTFSGFTYDVSSDSADAIWAGTHLMEAAPTIERIKQMTSRVSDDVVVAEVEICKDDLPNEIKKIALANIDVDLYEAVWQSLYKVAPLMAHRGIIIVEDPTSVPGLYGAYLALQEFLKTDLGKEFIPVMTTTQYFLIKV